MMPTVQQEQYKKLAAALKKADMWMLAKDDVLYALYNKENSSSLDFEVWRPGVTSDIKYFDALNRLGDWYAQDKFTSFDLWRWSMPSFQQLYDYAHHPFCPHRQGAPYSLGGENIFWLSDDYGVDQYYTYVDDGCWVRRELDRKSVV